jgi:hypothetical protein
VSAPGFVRGWVIFAALQAAGCAWIAPAAPSGGPGSSALAPQAALQAVAIGRSTRADVSAALGQAIVVPFDTGYEVWVYRWAGPDRTTRGATELVVLFDPTGRVTKVRLRPGTR